MKADVALANEDTMGKDKCLTEFQNNFQAKKVEWDAKVIKVSQLETEMNSLKSDYEKQLNEVRATTDAHSTSLMDEIRNLNKDIGDKTKLIDQYTSENNKFNKTIERLTLQVAEYGKLNDQLSSMNVESSEREKKITEFQTKFNVIKSELDVKV